MASDATGGVDSIDHRHLRSALEFAVLMIQEGQKHRPPLKYPAPLKKYLSVQRLPARSLPAVRRALEGDEQFRSRLATGALPELVDPIGQLWLERPDGWEAEILALVAEAGAAEQAADAAKELKRSEKRREAAEHAAVRTRVELVVLNDLIADRDATIDELRTDVTKSAETVDALRAELIDARNESRHARDRSDAARRKLEIAESERDAAVAAMGQAEHVRDDVLADRADLAAERSELARLAASALALAEQLDSLAAPPESGTPRQEVRRRALRMPGGVMGDSATAAEFLLRSGASVLVDGYNVAKLAWPKLDLEGQRVVLLDAVENLVRRFGSDITVVFDGADIVGAAADGRRIVRVVYSPENVIADDVIRDEVARLPATRQVVVVTNDQEIIRDVRADGANTMTSEQFLAMMR